MPTDDLSASTTFTSIYKSIFSQYSNPLVDGLPCVDPFSYNFGNNHQVYVLWCPLFSQAINEIKF